MLTEFYYWRSNFIDELHRDTENSSGKFSIYVRFFVLGCQRFVAMIYCDGQYFYWAAWLVFGSKFEN
jgi:hypothetical protein